ncbi:hypothetical protein EV130_11386 [Rhizobium azibense]|jgi:hypothetical protein|uniref:Uncharacterized protein n=1 Tax=Rhizobium azibense TaxID=1136135 RepID=A0A4R3QDG9_9HYPH|nr:hypothetical protein EV130_11386 [Rhizobium azibense]
MRQASILLGPHKSFGGVPCRYPTGISLSFRIIKDVYLHVVGDAAHII